MYFVENGRVKILLETNLPRTAGTLHQFYDFADRHSIDRPPPDHLERGVDVTALGGDPTRRLTQRYFVR